MSSTTCGFCGRYSHMKARWAEKIDDHQRFGNAAVHKRLIQGVSVCDNCGRASLGVSEQPSSEGNSYTLHFENTRDESFTWYPSKGSSPEFPDVPAHIAAAAKEAHAAKSINALMAGILMARTVVEATAKEKQIETGRLWAKIDALASAGHIRESTREAAHEIRHFGNDMAHGDIIEQPTTEDAQEVLELMDEVLNEVFQGPARTARIKAKRVSRTS